MNQTRLSGFPLLVVLALFGLPFITVTCNGAEYATVTGYDMVVGGKAELSGNAAGGEASPLEIEPLAVVAVVAAAIGALVAIANLDRRLLAAFAVAGAAALIGLMFSLRADFDQVGDGSGPKVVMSFAIGCWASLAAFGSATVLALWNAGARDGPRSAPP